MKKNDATGDMTAETIHEALWLVMSEAEYVQKQKAQGLKFSYAGEAQTIEVIRPALHKHGVLFYPEKQEQLHTKEYKSSADTDWTMVRIKVMWVFHHVPSKTELRVETMGDGADNSDKAVLKAMTAALKYALRQTHLLQTGDDPEDDVAARREAKRAKRNAEKEKIAARGQELIEKATTVAEVRKVLDIPQVRRYDDVRSKVEVLAERRIKELQ